MFVSYELRKRMRCVRTHDAGVALSTILISVLVNAFSSLYLYRTLRRDRMSPLDEEEVKIGLFCHIHRALLPYK